MDAVKRGFTHASNLGGRAPRAEFWYFHLFGLIVGIVIALLTGGAALSGGAEMGAGVGIIYLAYYVVFGLLNLSVSIRRLHDIGKSGWWVLLSLIPLVGILILIWWWAQPGFAEANKYGNNPLEA
jgi:Predicted membrane protein